MKDIAIGIIGVTVAVAFALGILWAMSFGWQYYKVFEAEMTGKAEYAQAEQNRQITILEAQAANEAATSQAEAQIKIAQAQAQAEIARAEGVAKANLIIADGLRGNTDYLRYLWIQSTKGQQVIYIPTEAGLPILEAGRR